MRKASYDGEPGSAVRTMMRFAGNRAITAWMSIHAFQNAAGPKELHWIDGASHNDLYYKKQYVDPSVEKLTGFFTQNLGQTARPRR
jgi:fermentation-respiration switch protein FrsA (DUF1100 family)